MFVNSLRSLLGCLVIRVKIGAYYPSKLITLALEARLVKYLRLVSVVGGRRCGQVEKVG